MSIRNEHGKARPQPPRSKDLPSALSAAEPNRGRDASGRFAPGNGLATERGIKALLKRQLGKHADDAEVQSLYRETRIQFLAELGRMPSKAPQVQRDLCARARWSALSARYAALAASLGLDTPEGQKALDTAMKLDARAERLGVTALDIAERLHRSEPKDPLAWLTSPAPTTPKALTTTIDAPGVTPPSESHVEPVNDKVDGPTNSGAA
jgi:hypothetical protein